MCTLLHQRYGEFSVLLLQEYEKHFQGGIDKSDDKVIIIINSFGRYLFFTLLLLQSVITSKYRLGLCLLGEVSISEEAMF